MESGLRHDVRLGVMIIPLICFDKLSAVIGQTTRSPNLDFSWRAGGIVYSCSWETQCAFGLLYFLDFLILNSFYLDFTSCFIFFSSSSAQFSKQSCGRIFFHFLSFGKFSQPCSMRRISVKTNSMATTFLYSPHAIL